LLVCASIAEAQSDPYLWALENVDTKRIERRGGSNEAGFTRGLLLTPGTRYRLHYLRRNDLAVGTVAFRASVRPTSQTTIPTVPMQRQPRADRDGDGLSDLAEAIAGSRPDLKDTDGDGFDNRAEVLAGTSPSDGLLVQTGIVAATQIAPSQVAGLSLEDDLALVASRDSKMLQVFNTFLRLPPREVGRISLPTLEPQGVVRHK
tara:strand:+ start:214 stop:825 length:612 start_codon:yes stop_codon:yes gene_type:complete